MSSKLFSLRASKALRPTKFSHPTVFQISNRQVCFQDSVLGLANKANLLRMRDFDKSGGPSLLMKSGIYGVPVPYFYDPSSVSGNEDTTRLYGLNTMKQSPHHYWNYPETVYGSIKRRSGLLEASFQYDDIKEQWNPDNVITYIAEYGIDPVKTLVTDKLFNSYLKRANPSDEQIINMYWAAYKKNADSIPNGRLNPKHQEWFNEAFKDGDPEKGLAENERIKRINDVRQADENLPSFTDVEFAYLFFGLKPSKRYNLACCLNGGHLISTETIASKLNELLKLKKAKDEQNFNQKLTEFLEITKGDPTKASRSEMIAGSLKELPLFNTIYQQNSSFMERNFEALCIKLDAYLLNLVKPSEKLVINLHFSHVFDNAPYFMTFLLGVEKDGSIGVQEVLTDASDPLSLSAKVVDSRLSNSIKIVGTPSANIRIVENPADLMDKSNQILKDAKFAQKINDASDSAFLDRIDNLFDLISDQKIKLRFLNGNPVQLSSSGDDWRYRAFAMSSIRFPSFQETPRTIKEIFLPSSSIDGDAYEEGSDDYCEEGPMSPKSYQFTPILTAEPPEDFNKNRKLNHLPAGFPTPVLYPEHVGAASPLNPLTTKGIDLTEELFKKLVNNEKI
ncbi:hypothetical protein [Sneathiella sp. HT1-7]|uniref:hypothetical protein n=1 Tax=Sneathiella sp. HT1-7 TaxID=2887192 RepID=UPI001D15AB33|nr:hypothetical protein [Sneathiella sp. HT1-7]MCC3306277.1 hypothetical protein [Sneathiella sp. HT1-7]